MKKMKFVGRVSGICRWLSKSSGFGISFL